MHSNCIFIRAWYGNLYTLLPFTDEIANHQQKLLTHFKVLDNGEEEAGRVFADFLEKCYVEAATKNAKKNKERGDNLRLANGALIATSVIALAAFFTFFFGNLDKANIKKSIEVHIVNPHR